MISFASYPWSFSVPGGGERQMMFYLSAIARGMQRWPELECKLFDQWNPGFNKMELMHYFSCMPSSVDFLSHVKSSLNIPLVVSPNFWPDPAGWEASGTLQAIKSILWLADRVIVNSKIEEEALVRLCSIDSPKIAVVYNAVEDCFFEGVSPDIFREEYEISGKFILNVGNVEPRKNQLAFLNALKSYPDLQLITVGAVRESWYLHACKEIGGEQFRLIDALPPGSELIRSAMAGCEFFAMPSLRETPSIACLEAAACGAKILSTDLGSPVEYFGDHVVYVNPYDVSSMIQGVSNVLNRQVDRLLRDHIHANYRWDIVVNQLVDVYSDVLNKDFKV